jgi:hypothetical protein
MVIITITILLLPLLDFIFNLINFNLLNEVRTDSCYVTKNKKTEFMNMKKYTNRAVL